MRILLTGGDGFLGSRLDAELSQRGHATASFDRVSHPALDITINYAFDAWMRHHQDPELVVHLAGSPGRLFCEDQPEDACQNNVIGTLEVAAACADAQVPLVLFSTSEVYGVSCDDGQVDEDSPMRPRNVYATSKMVAEQIARRVLGDQVTILRPTMPYGPGNKVGYGRAALPTFIANALAGTETHVHYGTSRSWCYIDDTIRALADLVEIHDGRVYNVGRDDDTISTPDLAWLVYRTLGAKHGLVRVGTHDRTITPHKNISCARLRQTGWAPYTELTEGIWRTADWQREQPVA